MITKNRIEWCIKETGGISMRQAYLISDVSYPTFRKWAKRYGLWSTNQAGKGIPKKRTRKYLSCSGKENLALKEDYNNLYINKL